MIRKFIIFIVLSLVVFTTDSYFNVVWAKEINPEITNTLKPETPEMADSQDTQSVNSPTLPVVSQKSDQTDLSPQLTSSSTDTVKDQIKLLLKKGSIQFSHGKYDKASGYYRKVLLLDPHNSDAYFNLGVIDEDTDKLEEALKNYQSALKSNPNDSGIITAIADVDNKINNKKFNPSKDVATSANNNTAGFEPSSTPIVNTKSVNNNAPVYPVYTNPNKHPVVHVIGRDLGRVLRFGLYTAGAMAGYDACGCFW